MQRLLRILALIRKELLALLKDKRSRFVLIGPPLIQLMVFGYAATFDLNRVPLAIYNQDDSPWSRELVARFRGSEAFEVTRELEREADIAELIDRRDVLAVLMIDARFGASLVRGDPAPVALAVDGRNSNTALILLGYARRVVTDFNEDWAARHGRPPPPAQVSARAWYNANLQSRWFIVPGIVALLTLVVTLVVTALSVAREREAGTFDQLMVTPLTPFDILIGKVTPGFLIGIVEASFIILMAVVWFEIPLRGSLPALYAGLGLFLLSAVGVGLMISSFAITQQQGLLGAFLFLVPAVILSGFATPIENMPHTIQLITLIDPLRYFLVVVRMVFLEGAGIGDLLDQFWPMALIGVVALTTATWLFRHRLY